jgi:hypothetical protein
MADWAKAKMNNRASANASLVTPYWSLIFYAAWIDAGLSFVTGH